MQLPPSLISRKLSAASSPPTSSPRPRPAVTNSVIVTGDEAAASKLSAATLGYFDYPELRYFVDGYPERRQPLINKGYYARVVAIRKLAIHFLGCLEGSSESQDPFQIVNLGCGACPFYFWLIHTLESAAQEGGKLNPDQLNYFEIDFPQVLKRKARAILKHPSLCSKLGMPDPHGALSGGLIACPRYKMIGVDMIDVSAMDTLMKQANFRPDRPTMFLAECVFGYLNAEDADKVIAWTASSVPNAPCALVNYDPCRADDRFGQMMLRNFRERGCELRSLERYSTLESLRVRFAELGYENINVADLLDIYTGYLDRVENVRIEQLELFDELEEWRLIQQHYYLSLCLRRASGKETFGSLESMVGVWGTKEIYDPPRFTSDEARHSTHGELVSKALQHLLEASSPNRSTGPKSTFDRIRFSSMTILADESTPHFKPVNSAPHFRWAEDSSSCVGETILEESTDEGCKEDFNMVKTPRGPWTVHSVLRNS